MSKVKDTKKKAYYSDVIGKVGLIVPLVVAAFLFVVCFAVNRYDLIARLHEKRLYGYWCFIGGAGGSAAFLLLYLLTGLKRKGVGARDVVLVSLDFLMLFLVALIALDYNKIVPLDMDYLYSVVIPYAAALVLLIILNILRKALYRTDGSEKNGPLAPNATVKEYLKELFGKFNFWALFVLGFVIFGGVYLAVSRNLFARFLTQTNVLIGVGVVGGLMLIAFIVSIVNRLRNKKVGFIDALFFAVFIGSLFAIALIINYFTVVTLVVWLVILLLSIVFLRVFAAKTHIEEKDETEKPKGKKRLKNFFKQFFHKYGWSGIISLACFIAALASVAISVDIAAWLGSTAKLSSIALFALGFMLCVLLIYFLAHMSKAKVGMQDMLLTLLDFTALLIGASMLVQNGYSIDIPVIVCACVLGVSVLLTIIRMFSIADEPIAVVAAAPAETEEAAEEAEQTNETEEAAEEAVEEEAAEETEEVTEEVTEEASEEVAEEETTEEAPAEEEVSEEAPEETYEETYEEPEPAAEETDTYEEAPEETAEAEPAAEEAQTAYVYGAAAEETETAPEQPVDEAMFTGVRRPIVPFSEKLEGLPDEYKEYYEEISRRLLSYKRVKSRLSNRFDTYKCGKTILAKISIVGKKSLRLYIALDPADYDYKKFYQRDVSNRKSYVATPMMLVIKSGRGVKRASRLITDLMDANNIVKK